MFYPKNMPYIIEKDWEPRYLFEGLNKKQLNNDICLINDVLRKNNILDLFIPDLNYDTNIKTGGPTNYSFLNINELTATGKLTKYKYTVHFNTFIEDYQKDWGNDTFGKIYYLQNGEIGKVRIVMWRDKKLTVIHLKKENSSIVIQKI